MMLSLNGLFGFLKKLALFVLIVAIATPLRYGSTNPSYLAFRLLHSTLSLKHSLLPDHARPTLSAEYRAFENILRMRPLAELDPLADPLTIIKELRLALSESNISPKSSSCEIKKEVFEYDGHTVDGFWIDDRPNSLPIDSSNILLYVHGGGFMSGDVHVYSGFECYLSHLFNILVLHVEYRLAPEHRLPAAVEDTVALYRALLHRNILPSQMMIMGDSAGGGLTLLTVQAVIVRQLPVPRGVIILSAWADLSSSGESYTRNRQVDVILYNHNSTWANAQILGPNHSQSSFENPNFSPLFNSFKGFPPMYINVGTAEVTEDDSRRVAKKAEEAGVDVTFEEGLHLLHVYPIFYLYFPEARNTLDNINKWIQIIFGQKFNE